MNTTSTAVSMTRFDCIVAWLDRVTDPFFEPAAFFQKHWQSTWIAVCCCCLYVIAVLIFNGVTTEMRLATELEAGEITQMQMYALVFGSSIVYVSGLLISFILCWAGVALALSRAKMPIEEHFATKVFFVLMWGECLYAIGLLVRTLLAWSTGNLEFSFSLQEVAFWLGYEPSTETLLLSKVDLFLLWEVIVIAIGIRKLFSLGWIAASFLSMLSIELVPILVVLCVD